MKLTKFSDWNKWVQMYECANIAITGSGFSGKWQNTWVNSRSNNHESREASGRGFAAPDPSTDNNIESKKSHSYDIDKQCSKQLLCAPNVGTNLISNTRFKKQHVKLKKKNEKHCI